MIRRGGEARARSLPSPAEAAAAQAPCLARRRRAIVCWEGSQASLPWELLPRMHQKLDAGLSHIAQVPAVHMGLCPSRRGHHFPVLQLPIHSCPLLTHPFERSRRTGAQRRSLISAAPLALAPRFCLAPRAWLHTCPPTSDHLQPQSRL